MDHGTGADNVRIGHTRLVGRSGCLAVAFDPCVVREPLDVAQPQIGYRQDRGSYAVRAEVGTPRRRPWAENHFAVASESLRFYGRPAIAPTEKIPDVYPVHLAS